MTDISAHAVMKLRKTSGQGMMACKKALQETDGDMDNALQLLRKRGLTTLDKRAGRKTSQGQVVATASENGKTAVMATLCCETDFVAKSEDFTQAAEKLTLYALSCPENNGAENILKTSLNGQTFETLLNDLAAKTGEKTEVGDYAKLQLDTPGIIASYVHFNKKLGTMLQIETNDENTAKSQPLRQAANDIAMHITATNPLAVDRQGIDEETVKQEKAIYAAQISNKPENIIDKIIEGKMKKFYSQNCLLEQPFVKDDKKTVENVLEQSVKETNGQAKIISFVRFSVSE